MLKQNPDADKLAFFTNQLFNFTSYNQASSIQLFTFTSYNQASFILLLCIHILTAAYDPYVNLLCPDECSARIMLATVLCLSHVVLMLT